VKEDGVFGRGWEAGQATIVAMKEVGSVGRDMASQQKLKTFEYVADVQPSGGGSVFRTVMHEPFNELHWRQPMVGDVVPVKCDPKREKAKFDTAVDAARDRAEEKARKARQDTQFEAMAHAAPGTAAAPPAAGVASDTEAQLEALMERNVVGEISDEELGREAAKIKRESRK
jgi:hypothetical protein